MIRSIHDLRCGTTHTVDLVKSAIVHTGRAMSITQALVDHVVFLGNKDDRIDLTRLFSVYKVRPYAYAAHFHVKINNKAPFPHCRDFVIVNPRLLLSVFPSVPLVLQTCQNPDDDIERLIDFIEALVKEQERGAQVVEIK